MNSNTAKEVPTRVRFGDVVRLSTERCANPLAAGIDRYVGLEHLEPSDLRIRSWGNVADGVTFTNRFRPGQVLFGKRRAYQRKVAVAEFNGICSSDIYVFEPADDRLLPELLPFICQTEGFFEYALKTSAGSLSPRTKWSSLADYEFDLPPIETQRRAARILHAVGYQSDTASALESSARTVSDAILLAAVVGSPSVAVADLLDKGPQNGVSPAITEDGDYPTVPIGAVRDGVVDTAAQLKWARLDDEKYERFLLTKGDILCVRGNGNRSLVGKVGMVMNNDYGCFYPDLLIRMRFHGHRIMPGFAVAVWNSAPCHEALIARAKTTNGIYKINGADIRAHSLPVPSLVVQQRTLDRLIALKQASRRATDRARSSRSLGNLILESLSP